MPYKQHPEEILKRLGIYQPKDIDIDLIAFTLGADIKRTPLAGYEGQIIGTDKRAIITINSNASPQRQLFSAGHECGHWINDRRKNLSLQCDNSDMKQRFKRKNDFRQNKEVRANQFSADLIMPAFMVKPYLAELVPCIETVKALANEFSTSLTSSAIRLAELNAMPCMLVCWDHVGKRRWFVRNPIVPDAIYPHENITNPKSSFVECNNVEVDADKWISNGDSDMYNIIESVFSNGYDVFSLIWWKDESQLIELA